MSAEFKPVLAKVATGAALTRDEARAAFDLVMTGNATQAQIGAFLMGLRVRGEVVDEIAAGAEVMRARCVPVTAPANAIDTCGTGGDARGTWNISTAASFVVAGAGVPVAKHGNRALSSKAGSADVLAALGVRLDLSPDHIARCIADAGIGFMFAPQHHTAMKHVAGPRTELGTRTIFNLLGPLSNPAGVKRQMVGVFSDEWVEPLAHVLRDLGAERAWIVHGSDGLDEITTTGSTRVAELRDGQVSTFDITPEDAGLPRADGATLKGADATANAAALRRVLEGEAGAYADVVLLNAAAALIVAGLATDLKDGVALARTSIASGAALGRLDLLVAQSNAVAEAAP
ncbi:anthranilate phosphoribosyltransferase [Zavarzinia sp. CC-PAN008]|uniref:anthranilate phosphoribosyltransferase n=1 Tax=Zavarzinia sp. CC-PAN008 TaxID=3243332 RepID=UPI003F748034